MDYGTLANSAVPHVTSLGSHFEIEYTKYKYSLVIECSFIILVLPLLSIWIYFSAKYKKAKRTEEGRRDSRSNREAMSEVDAKSEQIEEEGGRKNLEQEYTLGEVGRSNEEATRTKLEQVERKICYGVCFFILHVVAVNSFDCNILVIVCFYTGLLFYTLFNLMALLRSGLLMNLYVVPAVVCAFGFWLGTHKLGVHVG